MKFKFDNKNAEIIFMQAVIQYFQSARFPYCVFTQRKHTLNIKSDRKVLMSIHKSNLILY